MYNHNRSLMDSLKPTSETVPGTEIRVDVLALLTGERATSPPLTNGRREAANPFRASCASIELPPVSIACDKTGKASTRARDALNPRIDRGDKTTAAHLPELFAPPQMLRRAFTNQKIDAVAANLEREERQLRAHLKERIEEPYFHTAKNMLKLLLSEDFKGLNNIVESAKGHSAIPRSIEYSIVKVNDMFRHLGIRAELSLDNKKENIYMLTPARDRKGIDAIRLPLRPGEFAQRHSATIRLETHPPESPRGAERRIELGRPLGDARESEQLLAHKLREMNWRVAHKKRN